MLVFIDESGDAGLKIDSGSSPHFVVTLVVFQDRLIATEADKHITLLKDNMGMRRDAEFKFHKADQPTRERFLTELSQFDFRYFSVVINKAELTGKGFRFPVSFYKYACKLVCLNAKEFLEDSIVIIDGSGTREFKRQLATYLRKNTNDPESDKKCIKKVKLQDSKQNNLIQLVDMVCGAVARSYKDKSDSKIYRKIIAHREGNVQFWPNKKRAKKRFLI